MARLLRRENPNMVVGLFMLVLLLVLAGPNAWPRVLTRVIPTADEGVPCAWLRQGINRANHQSLLGRAATSPLELIVKTTPVPATPDGTLVISVIVVNNSLGTVAFLYNPNQVRIGDDGTTSGLGIVFNATASPPPPNIQNTFSYPEADIRLLGPRQRCVHRLEFSATQLPDPSIATGNATVKAYYRNTDPGVVQQLDPLATPIYSDQGLWTGYVESAPVVIPLANQ